MVGSAGVGITPGPSQWKSGVPVTPVGRVTEHVRVTLSPAMMGEEREEVRKIVAGSVEEMPILISAYIDFIYLLTNTHTIYLWLLSLLQTQYWVVWWRWPQY